MLVTLQRHAKARGYFSPERFTGRTERAAVHELALNPDSFTGRTDEQIISTLAHEMANVWQQPHGKPPTTRPPASPAASVTHYHHRWRPYL